MFDKRFIFGLSIDTLKKGSSLEQLIFDRVVIFIHYNNLDNNVQDNNEKHNEKWPYILDHPYRILAIGGSGSGKTKHIA